MDAQLREDLELLYSLLIRRLVYVDAMHGMRLHEPGQYCENPDFDRKRFWERFDGIKATYPVIFRELSDTHTEAKRIADRREVSEAVFRTIAKQSAVFKPKNHRTFCSEAIDQLHRLILFFHRLENRMHTGRRCDVEMVEAFRTHESLWNSFGFTEGDFEELQRGLAWELATAFDMQESHFAMEKVAELLSMANVREGSEGASQVAGSNSSKDRGQRRGKAGSEGPGRKAHELDEFDLEILNLRFEGLSPKNIAIRRGEPYNQDYAAMIRRIEKRVEAQEYLAEKRQQAKKRAEIDPPIHAQNLD